MICDGGETRYLCKLNRTSRTHGHKVVGFWFCGSVRWWWHLGGYVQTGGLRVCLGMPQAKIPADLIVYQNPPPVSNSESTHHETLSPPSQNTNKTLNMRHSSVLTRDTSRQRQLKPCTEQRRAMRHLRPRLAMVFDSQHGLSSRGSTSVTDNG